MSQKEPPPTLSSEAVRALALGAKPPPRTARQRLRDLFASKGGAEPLQFQLLGRMLLHAALVGAAAGLAGSLFFWGLEVVEKWLLEDLAGYVPLRAQGERFMDTGPARRFHPWLIFILPAVGALLGGIASSKLAPETRGGGSDAIIDAFHNRGANVRRRVPFVKALASILTLGSGGSGGREGPIMQIGGSIGSLVGRALGVTVRERRILLVAGTAAGMAAIFRTPLGAALLAVEVLHRDDFESDALVPSVLASVVSYSVFISFFGESTLFAHATSYPFVPAHLPLYALMAVVITIVATVFVGALDGVRAQTRRLPLPEWCKPALGGLLLGGLVTPFLIYVGPVIGRGGEGLGLLGGGYGAAQLSITGAPWFQEGWRGVQLLVLLGSLKIVATALTVGSGGSAGDFGPSLVIGGIFGGAFGRAAQLVFHDPRIDPGAFALVGMGTLYGGLAHVPIASLVMVCELAGSYDLLVPLMLAEGIAFVALRNRSLYAAQVATRRDSPAHRDDLIYDVLRGIKVGDVVTRDRPYTTFVRRTPATEVMQRVADSVWQDAFPVLGDDGKLLGVISADVLRTMTSDPDVSAFALADDLMAAPLSVQATDDLHFALEQLLANNVRELLVVDADGRIVGFLDEADVTRAYHRTTTK